MESRTEKAEKSKLNIRLLKIAAVVAALCLWQVVSMIIGDASVLLASPLGVIKKLWSLIFEEGFLSSVWFSFIRIAGGFLIALVCGILLASLAGRFQTAEIFIKPYMTTIKAVPVASFIVLALIWFSSSTLSVLISFLMVLPVIFTNTLDGIKHTDKKLLEAAEVFRVSPFRRLLYIYIPAVKPFLLSGTKISLGLAWKAGIAAEVIGIATGSIGERLYYAKVYMDSAELLAWTAVIVALSVAFEKLFVFLLKLAFGGLKKI